MCRIIGFRDFKYRCQYQIEDVGIRMRDVLSHGGPDDFGMYVDHGTGLFLGHRRLSILDLSEAGHQPMRFLQYIIVYNGEVYNFMEIRRDLEKEGYSFNSNSDTEVILKSFHRWGILKAVHRFRGMFAIALWDAEKKKIYLIRDRVGVKPLYYYYSDGLFIFASEIKSFHQHPRFKKEIDPIGLSLYLQYGYITSPYTIYKNVYKLIPGHILEIDEKGNISLHKYWSIEEHFKSEKLQISEEEAVDELESLLIESFKLRMVSDVPVGIFLSGGIDSSTVCTLLQKEYSKPLKTFTIGFFEEKYNEAEYAKKIAAYLGTDHTEMRCTQKEALDIIPKLPEIYDEPFGDSSAIPTFLVSKLAKSKVKVSLSADGGDEQFFGYARYWTVGENLKRLKNIARLPYVLHILKLVHPDFAFKIYNTLMPILPKWSNFKDKYIKLVNVLSNAGNEVEQYDISNKVYLTEDLKKLLNNLNNGILYYAHHSLLEFPKLDIYSLMMLYDFKTYLPDDILVKVDRATMSVALEGREPFLDHKLIEFTSRLPINLKYKNGISKYILRKILHKYIPKKLIDRPKMGFGIPLYEWFKNDLKNLYLEYLNMERIKKSGLFNHIEVNKILKDFLENRGVNHLKLWYLFTFELWREKWGN